jgi:hypothetical protein
VNDTQPNAKLNRGHPDEGMSFYTVGNPTYPVSSTDLASAVIQEREQDRPNAHKSHQKNHKNEKRH